MLFWIVVGSILSACVGIGAAFILMRRYSAELQATIEPQLESVKELVFEVQGALDAAAPQIKRSQTIIGEHSVTPRQIKVAERYLSEDIIDKYPEAKAVLGMISPRTAEYFEANPDIFLDMVERWGPRIKVLLGEVGESGSLSGRERGRDWVHNQR